MPLARMLHHPRPLSAHVHSLRPEREGLRLWIARLTLPLWWVLQIVVGMALPLVQVLGVLFAGVSVLLLGGSVTEALARGGLARSWRSTEVDVMILVVLGSVALLWLSMRAPALLAELGAALQADPAAWRGRCRRAARAILAQLKDRIGDQTPVRVRLDVPDLFTCADRGAVYQKGRSALQGADLTWLTIEGDHAALPIRVGIRVEHGDGTTTIRELLECRVPLHLAREDVWREDTELPFHAADPQGRRVLFGLDRTWRTGHDGATLGLLVGGDFAVEPLLRRLDEVAERTRAPGPAELAPLPRTWADTAADLAATATTVLGAAWAAVGLAFLLEAHHLVDPSRGVVGKPASILAATLVLFAAPALCATLLGSALRARDRSAWVFLVVAAVVPVALLPLGLPWWAPPLPLAILALVLPKAVRWRFGIGAEELFAHVDAGKVVEADALAQRFGVDRATVLRLVEHEVRCGRFHGSFDADSGTVWSADTTTNDAERQRCPGCGSVLRARGVVLRCGHCGTELGGRARHDPPMPMPLSLELAAQGVVLWGWLLLGPAYVSTTMLWASGVFDTDVTRSVVGMLLCAALPLAWWRACARAGDHLERGDPRGLSLAVLVCPPLWLLLRRPEVRRLFGVGVEPLGAALAQGREQRFTEAARLLEVPERALERIAPFLIGRRFIDAVVDWEARRLIPSDSLEVDGRQRCGGCGSPLRLGGRARQCAWCGCVSMDERGDTEPRPHERGTTG